MTVASKCPSCETNLPADAPSGLCPTCLLRAGLSGSAPTQQAGDAETMLLSPRQRAAPPEKPGTRFANYELIERLASGGMGVVYKARDVDLGRMIALKMILTGRFANEAEVQRFRHEAEAAANLDHPNIVPIYEIDEHESRQYFTMKFIEGGSLDAHMERFRRNPRAAASLLATVARAVHHGHRRGVLHRDLKPPNILIDEHGEPHITDFGVAKRIEDDGRDITRTGTIIGTPAYMAPEQAAGLSKEITVAADVYSLGAILYEILTGRPPFDADSPVQLLRAVIEEAPPRPRQIDPNIDPDLETICLKCLEKERSLRYQSAEELADDLLRFCRGELIRARPVGRVRRAWRWARRHPALSGGALATIALIIASLFVAISFARQREEQLLQEMRLGNLWSARTAAISFLWQLDRFSRIVEKMADDPGLVAPLQRRDPDAARQWLRDTEQTYGLPEGFESWFLVDADGIAIGRAPASPHLVGRDFSNRDYYQGAVRHLGATGHAAVHVSRIFRSEADGLYKFAVSAPVCVADPEAPHGQRLVGVIVATISTASTMGSLQLNDERREAALAGHIDPSTIDAADAAPYRLLVHPAYHRRDEAVEIVNDKLGSLPRPDLHLPELQITDRPESAGITDDEYQDPMAARDPRYAGRWLAAFAPVGNTEMVVIVQQRYDDIVAADRTLTRNLVIAGATALSIGILFSLGIAWYEVRRRHGMSGG